jgi:hypothetical protein
MRPLLLILCPLIFGLFIYLFFDGCTPWVWLPPSIGTLSGCDQWPTVTELIALDLRWVRFYVPDFLWAFSFAACFTYLDNQLRQIDRGVMYAVAVSPEVGQFLGWVPGTADTADLVLILLACWFGNRCMERSFQ